MSSSVRSVAAWSFCCSPRRKTRLITPLCQRCLPVLDRLGPSLVAGKTDTASSRVGEDLHRSEFILEGEKASTRGCQHSKPQSNNTNNIICFGCWMIKSPVGCNVILFDDGTTRRGQAITVLCVDCGSGRKEFICRKSVHQCRPLLRPLDKKTLYRLSVERKS